MVKEFCTGKKAKEYSSIFEGDRVKVKGVLKYDSYANDVSIASSDIIKLEPLEEKQVVENKYRKRPELSIHTSFSAMDGISSPEEYFAVAKERGINAIAITDSENVQAFPDVVKAADKYKIKPIYGCEFNVKREKFDSIYYKRDDCSMDFVAIDVETTGFSCVHNHLIEVSAVKFENGEKKVYESLIALDDYSELTDTISELTGITVEMLQKDGRALEVVLKELKDFIGDRTIVAHNAKFDVQFIEENFRKTFGWSKKYSFIDTVNFSKVLLGDQLKRFGLGFVANKLGVELVDHHRAQDDTEACFGIFCELMKMVEEKEVNIEENPANLPYLAQIDYGSRKKQLEVISLVNDGLVNVVSHDAKVIFSDEEGVISCDATDNFIEDTFQETNYKFTKNNEHYTFEYATEDDKKAILKLLKGKGSKKSVINLESEITKEKSLPCKGSYVIEINSLEGLNKIKELNTEGLISVKKLVKKTQISSYDELNSLIQGHLATRDVIHVTALVQTQKGLKNLFKAVSYAHTEGLENGIPMISWEKLSTFRNGLIFGTSGIQGIFKTLYENGLESFNEEMEKGLYDYIEISPVDTYLGIDDSPYARHNILESLKTMLEYGSSHNIPVVATSSSFYVDKNQKQYRDIFIDTPSLGGGTHYLKGRKEHGNNCFLSNVEMYGEMVNNFGKEKAIEIVFTNPQKIADSCADDIQVIHKELNTPTDDFLSQKVLPILGKTIPSIKEELRKLVLENVKKYEINGKLPLLIQKRLDKELNSIIGNGYAVTYYIAYLLVKKSNSDGYVVGSRGSVGSSFVAYLMGITEVNALAPHYYCPHCHFTRFKLNSAEKEEYGFANDKLDKNLESVDDGFDLPDAICPVCGKPLKKDGHDIPFETFLGFNGDKVPDIDLNFSGDYQAKAHHFCKEVFGEDHAFKAGTISTVAEKTAFAFAKKYYEGKGIYLRNAELDRRAKVLNGTKRTTGQHPGGIIIIPSNFDVYDFCPIQYPANKPDADWYTTHFDFHAIHDNVLKLDILGHDDPTVLKFLMDKVHENPKEFPFDNVKDIPLDDKKVFALLSPDQNDVVNSLAVPEFGTSFVREMLVDTQPKSFSELVKVSGLSHGTDVWLNNAKDLVTGTHGEKIPFKKVIGCRDDIMVQLIYWGLDSSKAFEIMEFVRKGKPTKEPETWEEHKKVMKACGIPDWYIWSCEQIKYMFPKAHATAYVMSAMRIAWFKVHKPLYFYSAYFSIRADAFDLNYILQGPEAIEKRIREIQEDKDASDVEKNKITVFEVAKECWDRGIKITKPLLSVSKAKEFVIDKKNGSLVCSLSSIPGLGESVANDIVEQREIKPFESIEDLKERTKTNKTIVEKMNNLGSLDF